MAQMRLLRYPSEPTSAQSYSRHIIENQEWIPFIEGQPQRLKFQLQKSCAKATGFCKLIWPLL
jgi:hypothetical protein